MDYVEVVKYDGIGYSPLVDFESWRVAGLRYSEESNPNNFSRVERHNATDEVFVLLQGKARLIIGGDGDVPDNLALIEMEQGVIYNIKKSVWHHIFAEPDCNVLIVENRNTTADNSQYAEVSPAQRENLLK